MMDDFYRAFEDRYRGSRELIQSRLRVYLPFVEPLKDIYPDCRAVDLGCGRGEWLELMGVVGIGAHGIDLDDGMLAACRERGLSVEHRDAIEYLQGLPAESVAVVSAFHVVEHIPFRILQELVQEALRVLAPAGLLILETPNPENLSVGACTFYYDPTHQQPIPPPLLAFLTEHYGFARTKILRLQESPELASAAEVTLENVLTAVSPDYSVVAQKCAESPDQMALFDQAFEREYGVNLEGLAGRFQLRIERFAQTQEQLLRTQEQLSQAQGQLSQTQEGLSQTQAQLAQSQEQLSQAQERLSQTQAQLAQSQEQLSKTQDQLSKTQDQLSKTQDQLSLVQENLSESQVQRKLAGMYASTLWRVTRPVRSTLRAARDYKSLLPRVTLATKIRLKSRMVKAGAYFAARPALKDNLLKALRPFPRLHARLARAARPSAPAAPVSEANPEAAEPALDDLTPAASVDLSESAWRIYRDLDVARGAPKSQIDCKT